MLFEVLVAQLKANIFLPDLENESESEFPKLQAGAFQTLAKKASSCVLQLFCLVKIITIKSQALLQWQEYRPHNIPRVKFLLQLWLSIEEFWQKCQLQHDLHLLWPELLTWDMKKNREVGSWVFSILNERSII